MITISEENIRLEDYFNILFKGEGLSISARSISRVEESFRFLKSFSVDKIIYGVNTGLGPMAQYRVEADDQVQLQLNLIRSHAAGSGRALPPLYVKATMISRLKSLSLAYSGIHPDALTLIARLINEDIFPFIPEHGGVGASGDLVQLAHLALVLIGEGEVFFNSERLPTSTVFNSLGIEPLKIYLREGLGLINGTSAMTGIGIVNTIYAKKLINWSVMASAMINEIVRSFDDHFSIELNSTKKHRGQQKVAAAMRLALSDSKLIEKRDDHLYNGKTGEKVFKQKIQEYYSLRCVPQVLGPVCDSIYATEQVLVDEVNSANDNPIVDMKNRTVYHGGNFHGDYVSFEMDKLKIAVTKLSMLAERQLNFLMNNKLNEILPPFVNLGTLGLNLGLQGTQFAATSTVAENQTLSNPMYIHSIPNNNDNQDIVSMGTNAALLSKKVIENTFQVLAVEFLAIIQSVDYLEVSNKLAGRTRKVYGQLREIVPVFTADKPKYAELEKITAHLLAFNPEIIE
ncbi:MAG: aromatic amino acid ammonia-lyase [Bacteroidales bacterium]|nr:aromatic amino acid ammonia-lyase [Bacteroidales bacterium]